MFKYIFLVFNCADTESYNIPSSGSLCVLTQYSKTSLGILRELKNVLALHSSET